ncbi:GNAT family N-acetyltransferase [Tianweitania populi]|uniref:N-acetyltransferase n=1 Tax=Tianweitania populi TaxID=1607949 RepID=A0A8J3DNF8_9HYPH|nr:N-acetyltransferase [Tianweitania populi]GHD12989.1 N-acetyltransferase [Tianweitania populi]
MNTNTAFQASFDALIQTALPEVDHRPVARPAFTLGAERLGDVVSREALLDLAMGANRKRKSSEKLRRGRKPAEGLALVARDEADQLVGTVRLWNVRLGDGVQALLLGPLAVEPSTKSGGIGSALMRQAITEATRLGHCAILLVGDPGYYERFGFSAAKTGDLAMPGPYERHRFLALELVEGWLDGAKGTLKASGRKVSEVVARAG